MADQDSLKEQHHLVSQANLCQGEIEHCKQSKKRKKREHFLDCSLKVNSLPSGDYVPSYSIFIRILQDKDLNNIETSIWL